MKTATLPAAVEWVDEFAFSNSAAFEAFEVDPANPNYRAVDGVLFSRDGTTLVQYPKRKKGAEYVVPESVRKIGARAFFGCASLKTITFPDGLEKISYGAFADCDSLTTITLPNGLKSLGDLAFYDAIR